MSHLDITDATGRWRVTSGVILNRKTNELRTIKGVMPNKIHTCHEEVFAKICEQAFEKGEWPKATEKVYA